MAITLTNLGRLDAAIRAAGVAITGVDLNGNVTPQSSQAAAQATINAFDGSGAADATFKAKAEKAAASNGIDSGQLQAGDKSERLARALALVVMDEINILRAAVLHPIVSITRAVNTATVTTLDPHGLNTGDPVRIVGTTLAAYNVAATATVTSATAFTYPVAGSPATPAAGSMFFAMGAIPATQPRTVAQVVATIKTKIAATGE